VEKRFVGYMRVRKVLGLVKIVPISEQEARRLLRAYARESSPGG